MIPFLIVIFVAIGISTPFIVTHAVKKHRYNVVFSTSSKRKDIANLNSQYAFTKPKTKWNYVFHCQNLNKYRKMNSGILEKEFFKENFQDVDKALLMLNDNLKSYKEYLQKYNDILTAETIIPESVKLNSEVYKKYEKEIIRPLKKVVESELSIVMIYEYTSPAGRNHYESYPHSIHVANITDESVSDFENRYRPEIESPYIRRTNTIPDYYKQNANPINDYIQQINHIEDEITDEIIEQSKLHNFRVTLHIEISAIRKLFYSFTFLNRNSGREYKLYDFERMGDSELVSKVLYLRRQLDKVYYIEDCEEKYNALNAIIESAKEVEDIYLEINNITLNAIKELNCVLNIYFCFDYKGDICIERTQIGLAEDASLYFEENPDSIFVEVLNNIKDIVRSINLGSKNKIAALRYRVLDKQYEMCAFTFTDYLEISADVDLNTSNMEILVDVHYLYKGQEIQRLLARQIVSDKTILLAIDSFLSEVKETNKYYSSRFSSVIKKLIFLRECYKDTSKLKFNYSSTITNSEEWMSFFNLRPNIEPIVLDDLSDGKLVCNNKIASVMRDYQRYAFNWANKLVSNSLSGILADDMGLGKTLEIISVLNADFSDLPNLIVCPASLLYNWENEFRKWCPEEKVMVKDYVSRRVSDEEENFNKRVNYIMSYDLMIRHIDVLKSFRFNYLILDEAQYIKNESTSRSKCAKRLVANHRFALTGTPLENKEDDLINIFDFVMPSLNEKYKLKFLSRKVLREYVSPFLLRRKKTDVLSELPEKNTVVVELDMGEKQKSMYETYKNTHSNENDQYIEILALLTKLRQICVCPQLINSSSDSGSIKIDYMFELIDNIIESNENVLIYSFFVSVFDYIEPLMKQKNIKYVRLDGSMGIEEKNKTIESFDSDDDIHCFLISLKAGGVGLNLTKANNVIFLDPWWNIAVENQASDRTHRIGQDKNVTIYRLICKGTIEEKVLDIQKKKIDLMNFFVESQGEDPLGKLSLEMMKEILK